MRRPTAELPTGIRRYVITTGVAAGLIVFAHLARLVAEGPGLLRDAAWVLLTLAAAGLAVWAWRLI